MHAVVGLPLVAADHGICLPLLPIHRAAHAPDPELRRCYIIRKARQALADPIQLGVDVVQLGDRGPELRVLRGEGLWQLRPRRGGNSLDFGLILELLLLDSLLPVPL